MSEHTSTKLSVEFDGLSADACAIIRAVMNAFPIDDPAKHGEEIGRAVGIALGAVALSLGPRHAAWREAYERGMMTGVTQTMKAVTATMVSQAGGLQ